ncbi:D-glycerate 3-kinase [Hibiscus syriacus]|uniref:D-glycerate 3-kinase n=1 Tax=Hibiscus syriacus TaxID=106335 RepID=A0A6A2X4N2_HIBSY|nr:D-glycerate 3-kinase [Hibiscus syriacus]
MTTKFDIEKFNGRNFSLWKLKMKVILRKDGCLAAINERPVDFTDDNKWIEMDENAMANFHLALADEVLSSIEEEKTAKEICDHLTKLYKATSLHNKIFLKRKLYTLRMPESTSVTENLVFNDVTTAVLQEENRRKNKEDKQVNLRQEEALTTMRGRSTERGQISSHKHGRSKSRSKKNLNCYNCGKNGHLKKDCWSLNKTPIHKAIPQTLQMMEMLYVVKHQPPWKIVSVGTIKLKMYDGTIKVVRDVRHVKDLKKNLLSYRLLDNNASKIETQKGIMKVFRGALVVMKGEKIAVNLYMRKGETLIEAEASVASCSSDSAMLWHQKLGHMSEQGMKVLVEQKLLPGLTKVSLTLCQHCITITSLGGAKYFVSFIDDYSKRCWVYLLRRSQMFSTFKNFKAQVKLDSGNKIKCFRTDNGGEYTSEEFDDFYRKEGIKRQFIVANTPQQNRVAERMNITLSSQYRIYLVNRAPSTVIELKTPMEIWTGKPSDYSNLHVFESIVLDDLTARKVIIRRDVIFVEDKLQRKEDDDSAEKKPIGNKWVFKIKRNGDDQVESSSSLGNMCSLNLHLEQLDVKTTFLHGNLEEEIYMFKPEGFEEEEKKNLVCWLNKSLYGIKQVSRCWYKRFDSFIMCLRYNRFNVDPCAYFKSFGDNDFVILLLYVDDMLVAGPNKDHIKELKAQLAREFEMKELGSTNKILGMQIHRDRSNRKIWLSQKNYLKKILSRFSMQDCKPISTPLPINFKLSSSMSPSSENERMEMSRVPYASAVGFNVHYDMHKPDIAQAVRVISRRSNLLISGYVDSDYARDLDKNKSTTGYVFKVAGGASSSAIEVASMEDLFEFICAGPLVYKVELTQEKVAESIDKWWFYGSKLCRLFQVNELNLTTPQKARFYHYYIPVFIWCEDQISQHASKFKDGEEIPPLMIGFSAPQGCGKTTLVFALDYIFRITGRKSATLSIDDFYLTAEGQAKLREENPRNALLELRGNAGSHDLPFSVETLKAVTKLTKEGMRMKLPRYDKSAYSGRGDRADSSIWPEVEGPLTVRKYSARAREWWVQLLERVVLYEGWMLGFKPLPTEVVKAVDPQLELVNKNLEAYYDAWGKFIQAWIVIKIQDPSCVYQWRLQAEIAMTQAGKPGMTDEEVEDFVSRYLPTLYSEGPNGSDPNHLLVIKVDEGRNPIL